LAGAVLIRFQLGFPWFFVLGFAWIGGTAGAGYRFFDWPCPRCGKPFVTDPGRTGPGAKACMHCGLPFGDEGTGGEREVGR